MSAYDGDRDLACLLLLSTLVFPIVVLLVIIRLISVVSWRVVFHAVHYCMLIVIWVGMSFGFGASMFLLWCSMIW